MNDNQLFGLKGGNVKVRYTDANGNTADIVIKVNPKIMLKMLLDNNNGESLIQSSTISFEKNTSKRFKLDGGGYPHSITVKDSNGNKVAENANPSTNELTYDFPIAGTYTVNGSYYAGGQRYESAPVTIIATGLALSASKTVVPLNEAVMLNPRTVANDGTSSEASNVTYTVAPGSGYTLSGNTITFTAGGVYRITATDGSNNTSNQIKIIAGTPSSTVKINNAGNTYAVDITDALGTHTFDEITGFKLHFNGNHASCNFWFGDNSGTKSVSFSNGESNDYIVLRGNTTFNTTHTVYITDNGNTPFPVEVTVLFDSNLSEGEVNDPTLTLNPTSPLYTNGVIDFAPSYANTNNTSPEVTYTFTQNGSDASSYFTPVSGEANKYTCSTAGTYTVKGSMTYNNNVYESEAVVINVAAPTLNISPTNASISVGGSVTFVPAYGADENISVTYSVTKNDGTDATEGTDYSIDTTNHNKITFLVADTSYTVTATYDGVSPNQTDIATVEVSESSSSSDSVTITVGESGTYQYTISLSDYLGNHSLNDIASYKLTFLNTNATDTQFAYGEWGSSRVDCSGSTLDSETKSITLYFQSESEPKLSQIGFYDNNHDCTYPFTITINFKETAVYEAPLSQEDIDRMLANYYEKNPEEQTISDIMATLSTDLTTSMTQSFAPYMAEAQAVKRIDRPLRAGRITPTVGAEVTSDEVSELFFNTNVSDTITLGAPVNKDPALVVTFVGGKLRTSSLKKETVELTATGAGPWIKTISNLPATDGAERPYYYWVEEVDIPNGYTPSYSYKVGNEEETLSAIDATQVNQDSEGIMVITNTKQEATTSLPESGGGGTKLIYTIGAMLLMMSGAGYTMYKRRRWYDE